LLEDRVSGLRLVDFRGRWKGKESPLRLYLEIDRQALRLLEGTADVREYVVGV
jgi:hypothetical protein